MILDPVLLCDDLGQSGGFAKDSKPSVKFSGRRSMSIKEAARIAQGNNLMGLMCRSNLLVSQTPYNNDPRMNHTTILTTHPLERNALPRRIDKRTRPSPSHRHIRRNCRTNTAFRTWRIRHGHHHDHGHKHEHRYGRIPLPNARRRKWDHERDGGFTI